MTSTSNTPNTIGNTPDIKHVNCPTCKKQVAWVTENRFRPFCCEKCQLIDFGDWAAERHAIPVEDEPDNLSFNIQKGSSD